MHPARRLAACAALVAGGCFDLCEAQESTDDERAVATVPVDGAEVRLSAAMWRSRMLVDGERGGDLLPRSVELNRQRFRPRPIVSVARGGELLGLVERHPSPANWFRAGRDFEDEDEARAALDAIEATTCAAAPRVAWRLAGGAWSAGWHGLYVERELAVHVKVDVEADATCEDALAAMRPLDDVLADEVLAGEAGACDLHALRGRDDEAFDCALTHPGAVGERLRSALAAAIGAGAEHTPDREAQIFACLDEGAEGRRGCVGLLPLTKTAERRRAFLVRQIEECWTGDPPALCLEEARLIDEVRRLDEREVCERLLPRIEGLVEHGGTVELATAGRYAAGVTGCAPQEAIDAIAEPTFLRGDDADLGDEPYRFCPPSEMERYRCGSLPRLAAARRAARCDPDDVARSRAALDEQPIGRTYYDGVLEHAAVDGALRVLSACAPDEARARVTAAVSEPIPRQRILDQYGLGEPPAQAPR